MHWSDHFTAGQMREMFNKPTNSWTPEFRKVVHEWLAYELLDGFLEAHDDEQYRERVKSLVENETYGYEDDEGNEMLDFE